MASFQCPHMSIGNVVAARCGICGPLAPPPVDIRHLPETIRREVAYALRGQPVTLADETD
jgi:hypothetical protein